MERFLLSLITMAHRHHALLALALLLGASSTAAAAPHEIALAPETLTLRGRVASHTFTFSQPASGAVDGDIVLPWRMDGLSDPEGSLIEVALDGRPLWSTRVAQLYQNGTQAPITVQLSDVGSGPHALTLKVRHKVDDDDCDFDDELAWFVIERDAKLRLSASAPAPPGGHEQHPIRLGYLAEDWGLLDRPIRVAPPVDVSVDTVAGYLQADHALRLMGLETELASASEPADLFLRVGVADINASHRLVRGRVNVVDGLVTVEVGEPVDLAAVVSVALSAKARFVCETVPCVLGAGDVARAQPSPEIERGASEVFRLGLGGYPDGWVADGAGVHRLRFTWRRPADWQLESRAVLSLDVTRTRPALLDQHLSHIKARFNGQPMATWPVGEDGQSELKLIARLPKTAAKAREWTFDLEVGLQHASALPCAARDDDALWLRVAPTSTLSVEHTASGLAGIAAFGRRAQATGLSRLLLGGDVSWSGIARASQALVGLARLRTGDIWGTDGGAESKTVVTISEVADAGLELAAGSDSVLDVRVGQAPLSPNVPEPDFLGLAAAEAAFVHGRWLSGEAPRAPQGRARVGANGVTPDPDLSLAPAPNGDLEVAAAKPELPAAGAATMRSTEDREAIFRDVMWLVGGGLFLIFGMRWIYAGWRKQGADDELPAID